MQGYEPMKSDELTAREAKLIKKLRELEQGFDYHLTIRSSMPW